LDRYLIARGLSNQGSLGEGKDGSVWQTSRGSARLDSPPDLIEDEGHTLYDLMEDRFGDLAPKVMALYEELAAKADLYLLDFHPQNIKFAPSDA
jgi:hypothetical protein